MADAIQTTARMPGRGGNSLPILISCAPRDATVRFFIRLRDAECVASRWHADHLHIEECQARDRRPTWRYAVCTATCLYVQGRL